MTKREYNTCVDQFSDAIFRFIVKNIGHRADAEDVVQTAFERLWKVYKDISFEKAKSYLFTTAYRCMIDMIRKTKRIVWTDEVPEGIARNDYERFELSEVLEKALGKLNEIQRSVLLLRDYEGYSYKEIATITKLNESQVKVYIFRARKKLQLFLKNAHEAA